MTVATDGHTSFPKCQYCGKEASATQRIRACTRCYAVGYCSKDCQRQDWSSGKGGHKKKCRPRPRPTNDNDATDIAADATAATPTSTRPAPNNEVVRLEVKRGGDSGNDEVWEDAGPINMLGETMTMDSASISSNVNQHTSNINQPASSFANKNTNANAPPKPKPSLKKELPTSTQQILGPIVESSSSSNKYNYRHSSDGIDTNLLIFLHGAGDTHVPFDTLGQTMQLPQTATLSLSASIAVPTTTLNNDDYDSSTTTKRSGNNGGSTPTSTSTSSSFVSLPFGLGSTWFEEMDYQVTGEILPKNHPRRLSSLSRAVTMLDLILCSLTTTTTGHCNNDDDDAVTEETKTTTTSERTTTMMGWIPERIFLFGFSAGACLAMEVCRMRMMNHAGRRMPLGGAICIAGGIRTKDEVHQRKCPDSTTTTTTRQRQQQQQQNQATDVLIITGSNDAQYPKEAATLSKQFYHHHPSKVTIHIQSGKGHAMIGSKEEMQVVMEFLSKRLVKRMVSMEGLARNDF